MEKVFWIVGSDFSPSFDGFLVGDLADEIEGEMSNDSHVFGTVPGSEPRLILAESDIEYPVQVVFNGPVATDRISTRFRRE